MEYIQLNKESGSTTRINFNNGVPYISYRILDDIPWLKNAVSTRLGGVSKDYLAGNDSNITCTTGSKGSRYGFPYIVWLSCRVIIKKE